MATKVNKGTYKTSVYLGKDANGKRIQKVFYGKTADEADFLALQFKIEKKKQEDKCSFSLGDAIDKYIAAKDAILSPKTIEEYKKMREIRFKGIMNLKLCDINSTILQEAINNEAKIISNRGKPLSAKSIKNAYGLVISTVNYFYPDKRIKVTLPKSQPIKYQTPDSEALAAIFKATKGTSIEIPVLLASWLSLRMSEICGLKWSDIHENYVDINEAKIYANGQMISKSTKTTSSARRIPLPQYIKELLDKQERKGEYITNMRGSVIYDIFTDILDRNGLPRCRFHDLRHANASIMLQLGVPDKYAQERGGWASNSVMKKIYQQTFSSEQIKIAEKIDSHFMTLI